MCLRLKEEEKCSRPQPTIRERTTQEISPPADRARKCAAVRAEVHRYSEQTRRNNSTLNITRLGFSDQFSDYIESLLLFSLWKSRNGSLVWGGRHRENDDRHMSTCVQSPLMCGLSF